MSTNTLTGLIQNVYRDLNLVTADRVGLIQAVTQDSTAEQAGLDQTIRIPVAAALSATDVVAASTTPDVAGVTHTFKDLTISKSRNILNQWNSEEAKSLSLNGALSFDEIQAQSIRKSMVTLTNEVETDLASLQSKASRAFEPTTTTLFSADFAPDMAQLVRGLDQNGVPNDRTLILGLNATESLQSLDEYLNANFRATGDAINNGVLINTLGMRVAKSAQIVAAHTIGDGTTGESDGAHAIGATSILVTVTDEIVAGDIINFAGSPTINYVVLTGTDGDGTITIQSPGLIVALADNEAIVILNQPERNMCIDRSAITLVTRAPADQFNRFSDKMTVTDPNSGLVFTVTATDDWYRRTISVGLAWGFDMTNPEAAVLLVD